MSRSDLVRAFGCISVLVMTAALTTGAGATPATQALIRPAKGIGMVNLGMSLAQVSRALGPAHLVNRRQDRGFGVTYVEYAWDYGFWRVGLLGKRGRLKVVRVATVSRAQRTRERIGRGSTVRQLWRTYGRRATCIQRDHGKPDSGAWIVVRGPGPAMTAFSLEKANPLGYYKRARPPVVGEVLVQYAWLAPISGRCEGWQGWRW